MYNFTGLSPVVLGESLIGVVIFVILVLIGKRLFKSVKASKRFESSRFLNPQEYLPEEELTTIKQVLYLIMIVFLVVNILYNQFMWNDSFNMALFDIIISLYLAINLDLSSLKNKFILLLLIPFGAISQIVYPHVFLNVFDLIHVLVFLYFIKIYYQKFIAYTEDNSLGITIMLLFLIVFISFVFTIFVEDVSPLNAIEMVSNAFTSNGYSILGKSPIGKLNAIFLVWSGFILSGVGTATLTAAIVMRHVNEKFDRLEELAKKNNKK